MSKYFVLAFLLFSIVSCEPGGKLPLPSSAGGFDQLMIVMDNDHYLLLKDSINKYFENPYEVLNQNEASLEVASTSYAKLNSLMKRYRNIIFIGIEDQSLATDKYVKSQISKTDSVVFKRNMWAQPQIAAFLLAEDIQSLKESFSRYAKPLRNFYLKAETSEYKDLAFASGVNIGLNKQLEEYYGFTLDIPQDFILAANEKSFIWLRRDDPESTINIMIFVHTDSSDLSDGIDTRNELGKRHVSSNVKGAYMVTDTLIPIITNTKTVNNSSIIETRGLWRMKKDFKGGPFLNICRMDESGKPELCIDGFVYAPGEKKKGYIRQLEAIFSTLKFKNNS